jgi:hypothetical protein
MTFGSTFAEKLDDDVVALLAFQMVSSFGANVCISLMNGFIAADHEAWHD